MSSLTRVAEQTYTFAEVCRLLHLPAHRARELRMTGEFMGPDIIVPGGGRKGERWTASRVALIQAHWSPLVLAHVPTPHFLSRV